MVVTHFEIWAASQISEVIDQSHRIWQSNGPAAHVSRFAEPLGGAGSIAGRALRKWSFSAIPGCYCSQITANSVIAKSGIRRFPPRL
jgi:hypothetical protein